MEVEEEEDPPLAEEAPQDAPTLEVKTRYVRRSQQLQV